MSKQYKIITMDELLTLWEMLPAAKRPMLLADLTKWLEISGPMRAKGNGMLKANLIWIDDGANEFRGVRITGADGEEIYIPAEDL